MSERRDRRRLHERGSVITEFALSLPVVVLLIGGLMDISMALREQSALTEGTRVAARLAAGSRQSGNLCEITRDTFREVMEASGFSADRYELSLQEVAITRDGELATQRALRGIQVEARRASAYRSGILKQFGFSADTRVTFPIEDSQQIDGSCL